MKFSLAVCILFLVSGSITAQPDDIDDRPFKEVKQDGSSKCEAVTFGEGKYTYSPGNDSYACCTIAGMNDFRLITKKFTLKSNNGPVQPTCCLTANSVCGRRGVRCCNNAKCANDKCVLRKAKLFSVKVTLAKDNCADPKRKYHMVLNVGNYTGDACCDTDKIHMIQLVEHCCSVSNAPFIKVRQDMTPDCCGRRDKSLQFQQYGNGNTFSQVRTKIGGDIAFCRDNLSGSFATSKDLKQDRFYLGNPRVEYNKTTKKYENECCRDSTKRYTFKPEKVGIGIENPVDPYKICCSALVDRFREKDDMRKNCCVYSGKCHTEGFPCCSGKCVRISPDNEDPYYDCGKDKDNLADFKTEQCKK